MDRTINLIFDLDGCLIDSSEVQKEAFFNSYALVIGDDKCPSYEEYIKHTGDSLDNVLRKLGLPDAMAAIYRKISSEAIDKVIVNWSAIDLIKEFRERGSKIAIVTGKDHYRTVDILKYYAIEAFFDAVVCADDVPEPKPSAIPVLKAIEALKISRENTILIGDGYNDILSARGAGIRSILTLWFGDQGVPRKADFVVKSVGELRRTLMQLLCSV